MFIKLLRSLCTLTSTTRKSLVTCSLPVPCGSLFCTETSVILRDQANLWPGNYKVSLEITDQQGKSCTEVQVLNVLVCSCLENTRACVARETSTAKFGALGVLLFLLGLLLLIREYIVVVIRIGIRSGFIVCMVQ